jgi:hypothetical protein
MYISLPLNQYQSTHVHYSVVAYMVHSVPVGGVKPDELHNERNTIITVIYMTSRRPAEITGNNRVGFGNVPPKLLGGA